MPVLLTNFGALAYLRMAYKDDTAIPSRNVRGYFLISDPVMDRTKVLLTDWPFDTNVTDPGRVILEPSAVVGPVIVAQRALLQWGPPAYELTSLTTWDCYGMVFATDNDDAIWVDRWASPRKFVDDEVFQIIPSVTMTSECPPLGGCS